MKKYLTHIKTPLEKFSLWLDLMWAKDEPLIRKIPRRVNLALMFTLAALTLSQLITRHFVSIPFTLVSLMWLYILNHQQLVADLLKDFLTLSNKQMTEWLDFSTTTYPFIPNHLKEKAHSLIDNHHKEFDELVKKYPKLK